MADLLYSKINYAQNFYPKFDSVCFPATWHLKMVINVLCHTLIFEFQAFLVASNINLTTGESAVPVAARSKAWVCGSPSADIVGSNPTGIMDVFLYCCAVK